MTAHFVSLRIAGFKSFADPVNVDILPGLTGIVGPNGCGKSNVVEALRWAMGESNARSLRGGEMDDLIFAGTVSRPARNLAEVTLSLREARGLGPGAFAEADELEITRRAERGSGSDYRLNGRAVRGRDVQTLFADLSSGARSSGMVSQGRVAALVGARPEERRSILEEAAGITGLHARRHEAELRLRATETNLTRAEDLRTQLEARLEELTEQSGQAAQYRELSSGLRESENLLLALLHARARAAVAKTIEIATQARSHLTDAEEKAETAVISEFEATKSLPALRARADEARTMLERRRIAAETVAQEEARAAKAAEAVSLRLEQNRRDRDDAAARLEDARTALTRIEAEQKDVAEKLTTLPERQAENERKLADATGELKTLNESLERLTTEARTARLRQEQAEAELQTAQSRHARLSASLAELDADLTQRREALPSEETLHQARQDVARLQQTLEQARSAAAEADRQHSEARLALSVARSDLEAVSARHRELQTALQTARQRHGTLSRDREAVQQRCVQAERDLVPEDHLSRLEEALQQAASGRAGATEAAEAAEAEKVAATAELVDLRGRLQEADSLRAAKEDAVKAAGSALVRAGQESATLERDLAAARKEAVPDEDLSAAVTARKEQEAATEAAVAALEAAETALAARMAESEAASAARTALQAEIARVTARIEGLAQAGDDEDSTAPVSDTLTIPDGLEIPLAAALGEGLSGSDSTTDPRSPRSWREGCPAGSLPEGAIALASLITHPPVLNAALNAAGLVEDDAAGEALRVRLLPGQCLVSRDGALWRWDGWHILAGQPDPTALRLARKRALREAEEQLAAFRTELDTAAETAKNSGQKAEQAAESVRSTRTARTEAESTLSRLRVREADISRRHAAAQARLDTVQPQYARAALSLTAAREALKAAETAAKAIPEPGELKTRFEAAQAREHTAATAAIAAREQRKIAEQTLDKARQVLQEARSRHDAAQTRLATLLPDRARLDEEATQTQAAIADAEAALVATADQASAARTLEQAEQQVRTAAEAVTRSAREAEKTGSDLRSAEEQATRLHNRIMELTTQISALESRRESAVTDLNEAQTALETAQARAAAAVLPDEVLQQTAQMRADSEELALTVDLLREERAALSAEKTALEQRTDALLASQAEWHPRMQAAEQGFTDASTRLDAVTTEYSAVSSEPEAARRRRETGMTELAEAEALFSTADQERDAAEKAVTDAQNARRSTEAALAEAREALVRAEGRSEQARAILDQLLAETPEPPRVAVTDLSDSAESSLRRKIARLVRERDELGPVNLRADLEVTEAETRIDMIRREHAELEEAITRLRGSITSLNKEGRERLMAVFTQVDHHFQTLFSRMFGGGRAHLGMVGSDDPLQAGLEIYAQPPGKKLATLSLLSGGEQALTALSLIFAVFRCNPAPVCVLDEVDAPLDDANVGRFCALLGDMAAEAGTRFLVVTHHQLTMAHMNRLYGVTMQERGVSRVLSVDLERASEMAGQIRGAGETI
ncbi:AAA family ATPase [Acetobacter sp. AN02]|uniref:AAA family ATPase n=1 Tax=Acetobacter sp. AN02 TaxID=2894186 RepID=UPI0024341360|nr:AAA family ATPase [Acetobacter sp. AN02]MDG6093644.1 AAA family ATPase [Acetobacter sp. AN02]